MSKSLHSNTPDLRHNDAALTLPPCTDGIIDTVEFTLPMGLHPKDRKLLNSSEWNKTQRQRGRVSPDEYRSFNATRDSDGCRVWTNGKMTLVTASIPRLLGLPNHSLHLITQDQTREAFALANAQLLPYTTKAAAAIGAHWAIRRIDLARDFEADIQLLALVFGQSKWFRTAKLPTIIKQGQTVHWKGKIAELQIYDKFAECTDRRESLLGEDYPNGLVRIERRFRQERGLQHLIPFLSPGIGLPILSRDSNGKPVVVEFALSLADLHRALQHDIVSINSGPTSIPTGINKPRDALIHALSVDPSLLEALSLSAAPRTMRNLRKEVRDYRASYYDVNLLEIGYPGTKIRPPRRVATGGKPVAIRHNVNQLCPPKTVRRDAPGLRREIRKLQEQRQEAVAR